MKNPVSIKYLVLLSTLASSVAWPQQPPPSFDVASVRLSDPVNFGGMGRGQMPQMGAKIDGAGIEIKNMSLRDVIVAAYRIRPFQLEGPDWMSSTRVDIAAKLPSGGSTNQIPEMLQTLLSERFGLTLHKETREEPVYALTVSKNGLKMKESPPDPDHPYVPPAPNAPDFGIFSRMADSTFSGDPRSGSMVLTGARGDTTKVSMSDSGVHMEISRIDLPTLTDWLSQYMDHPVIDKTDLKSEYQVTIDASMEDMMNFMSKAGFPGGPGRGPGGPGGGRGFGGGRGGFGPEAGGAMGGNADAGATTSSTIVASVQRLGLKLTPEKAPFPVTIVDHLNKTPTAN